MDDNRPDDPTLSPDSGRPRREPPTIDLEASEVSRPADDAGQENTSRGEDAGRSSGSAAAALHPLWVAGATGAVTAALVLAIVWAVGWPAEPARPISEINTGAIEALTSRVGDLEAQLAKHATPDPAVASRLDALAKSLAALKTELGTTQAQSQKLAAELDAVKSAPAAAAPPAPDLSDLKGRLAEVEQAVRADKADLAQVAGKPADDTALRRLVVASMLEISVRQGEPFSEALNAAKTLAVDPQQLKPLDDFAAAGVPRPPALCRELLTLVPKLEPPSPPSAAASAGIVDHLRAGAAKLVRIERTDAVGNDRGAIVARVTAAALRNDLAEARRELSSLNPDDRAAAKGWLAKADERDAALAASRHFAAEAMAALAKPAP